ncbi:hypothetical protein C8Q70DRAFT_938101 [Cubamyces menziesii]|nr:hypothetical protein C8Q70DRAFT_938101 [Cubamyces menziesii]
MILAQALLIVTWIQRVPVLLTHSLCRRVGSQHVGDNKLCEVPGKVLWQLEWIEVLAASSWIKLAALGDFVSQAHTMVVAYDILSRSLSRGDWELTGCISTKFCGGYGKGLRSGVVAIVPALLSRATW